MRIAFFGSSAFSCHVLGQLIDTEHEVVAVVTQPDQPAGRSLKICPTQVCAEAEALGFPVLKPARLRGNATLRRELADLRPDCLLVASYGQIIPPKLLALTEWPLNVHPSMLPALRGASPVRTALLQGLEVTACCIMRMTPRLDDGDVLCCQPHPIGWDVNYETLEYELGVAGGELAAMALELISVGAAEPVPQDHAQATYCGIYRREHTWIDWNRPCLDLYNFLRAWDPDVGAVTTLPDGRRLKLWKAEPEPFDTAGFDPQPPGTVLYTDEESFAVATADGMLWVRELQPESRSRMATASFLTGNPLAVGQLLGQAPRAGCPDDCCAGAQSAK